MYVYMLLIDKSIIIYNRFKEIIYKKENINKVKGIMEEYTYE